jgi:hypothetical protein
MSSVGTEETQGVGAGDGESNDLFSELGRKVLPQLEGFFKPAADWTVQTAECAGAAVKDATVSIVDSPMSPFAAGGEPCHSPQCLPSDCDLVIAYKSVFNNLVVGASAET